MEFVGASGNTKGTSSCDQASEEFLPCYFREDAAQVHPNINEGY
jgi:hypothetical protein